MPAVSFTGLSSGLDTDSIVSALMAVDQQGVQRLGDQKTAASTRQTALQDVLSRMKNLRLAEQDLSSQLLWSPTQTLDVTDTSKVSATVTGGAAPGGYALSVTQLATAAQSTYAWNAPAADTDLTINGTAVHLAAGTTLDQAVESINGDASLGVFAVNVQGKMVLSSRTTGASTAIDASGDAIALQSSRAGQNARYSVNGGDVVESESNAVTDAIPGVKLTFKALTSDTAISVSTPGVDSDAIKTKLQAFIDAYNDVVDFVNGKVTEKTDVPDTSDSSSSSTTTTTTVDPTKGVLYNDGGLEDLLSTLRQTVSNPVTGLPQGLNSFANLGITTGAPQATGGSTDDSLEGKLTLDADTFEAAVASDPLGVQKLLGGVTGTRGLGQILDDVIGPQAQAGGLLDQRVTMAGSEVKDLNDQISDLNDRLSTKQAALKAQFAAMETALAQTNSQYSSMLSSLGTSSS